MATLELLQIREVTLGSQGAPSSRELQVSRNRARLFDHLIAVVTGAELVELPLTVLVAQSLGIAQSLYMGLMFNFIVTSGLNHLSSPS